MNIGRRKMKLGETERVTQLLRAHCHQNPGARYVAWDEGWSDERVASEVGVGLSSVANARVKLIGREPSTRKGCPNKPKPAAVEVTYTATNSVESAVGDNVVTQLVAALKPMFDALEHRIASLEEMVLRQDSLIEAHSQSILQDSERMTNISENANAYNNRLDQHRAEQSDVNASLSKRITGLKDFAHQVNNSLGIKIERLERIVRAPIKAVITKGPKGTLVRFTTRDGTTIKGDVEGDPEAGFVEVDKKTHQMALDIERDGGPKADVSIAAALSAVKARGGGDGVYEHKVPVALGSLGDKLVAALKQAG